MDSEEVSRLGLDADRISFFADRLAEVSRIKWIVYHEGSDEDVEDLASYAGEVVELRRSSTALAEAQATIARLEEKRDDEMFILLAEIAGELPDQWKPVIQRAIVRKCHEVSSRRAALAQGKGEGV